MRPHHPGQVGISGMEARVGDRDKRKTSKTTSKRTHKGLDKQLSSLVVQMQRARLGYENFSTNEGSPGLSTRGATYADKESKPCSHCAESFERKEAHGKKRRKDTHGATSPQSQC